MFLGRNVAHQEFKAAGHERNLVFHGWLDSSGNPYGFYCCRVYPLVNPHIITLAQEGRDSFSLTPDISLWISSRRKKKGGGGQEKKDRLGICDICSNGYNYLF